MQQKLKDILKSKGISNNKIDDVIASGYTIRRFGSPFGGQVSDFINDQMYGNKQPSGIFDIDTFVEYIQGKNSFDRAHPFPTYNVKNIDEINEVLSVPKRAHYIKEGRMSFRGQTSEYMFKRKVPNPIRSDDNGYELSIFPGIYRQKEEYYSFDKPINEKKTFQHVLRDLEPNNPDIYYDSPYSHDIMRVEQHYASHTHGLDIAFDIETAIFFSTHKLKFNQDNKASYEKVEKGSHKGVIYGFCFREPTVNKTEFLIKDFSLFKTYPPERILRQDCGLPLILEYERNIAITDLDFIMYLDDEFDYEGIKDPLYMFPNIKEDKFYKKLLELKIKYPEELGNVVEYI